MNLQSTQEQPVTAEISKESDRPLPKTKKKKVKTMQVDINTKEKQQSKTLKIQGFNPKTFALPKRPQTQAQQTYLMDPKQRKKDPKLPPELKLQKNKSREPQMNET